uniref:Protein inhibitor of activated STAT n=1 Tax=Capitella teleta TaxID=283909 RepID=X2B9U9_CAPTE
MQHMVMSFRVSELQVLLGFAGRNKSGRKQELLQRALALLDGCGAPIQIKIRELSKRRFPSKAAAAAAAASSSSSPHTSPLKQQPHAPLPQPGDGLEYKHTPAMPPNHNQVPVLPDVSLKMLPFYDVLDELLKPSSLVPKGAARFQETFFVFHLTPQQAQDVAASRYLLPLPTDPFSYSLFVSREMKSGRIEHSVQVQLRFCLLETSCDQEDNFPPSICVRVNGKMAPLPNPIPTNKAGVEPKRPSRPVNITSICRISPTHPNQISISWASELGRSYCVAVHLVRKLNSDILLSRMKRSGIKHPDHTTALIKEKLAHDPDNEIATTSLRVSLQCPLGKMRMTIPSRASTCNHLQCFDAPMFLLMNEKKPTWTCPVCDKPALFYNLIIDGLFTEILKKTSEMEIEFLEDGSWRPLKPK